MSFNVKRLTRAAVIAAAYCVLTLIFQPISFGAVQFRVSEALTLLPLLTFDAVPGLFVGCLLANLFCGASVFDIVFGSIATLIAAVLTWKLAKKRYFAAAMPAILNGLIVGPVVYFCYEKGESLFSPGVLLFNMLTVAVGEVAVCYILGLILVKALEKVNEKHQLF